jgi:hypothetical protein
MNMQPSTTATSTATPHFEAGMTQADATEKCWRCRGDGSYFRLPDGCNPFAMRMPTLVGAMYRVNCFECKGSGRTIPGGLVAFHVTEAGAAAVGAELPKGN